MTRKLKILSLIVMACVLMGIAFYWTWGGDREPEQERVTGVETEPEIVPLVLIGPTPGIPPEPVIAEDKIIARKHQATKKEYPLLELIEKSIAYGKDPLTVMRDNRSLLIDMLGDIQYQDDWPNIAKYIAFAGESDEASLAIIDFLTREEQHLSDMPSMKKGYFLAGKAASVKLLGYTRGEEAQAFLRESFTEKGAKACVANWIDHIVEVSAGVDRRYIYSVVRGRSAMALMVTQDPENIKMVTELYTKTNTYLRNEAGPKLEHPSFKAHGPEHSMAISIHGGLVEAMVINDVIKEKGYEEYLVIIAIPSFCGTDRYDEEYRDKYTFDYWNYL